MAFITRLLKSSKTLIVPLLLAVSLNAAGEGISATRAEAKLTHAGQLSVSSRFRTDLPDQLKEALKQGVPLHFNLSWQLSAPSMSSTEYDTLETALRAVGAVANWKVLSKGALSDVAAKDTKAEIRLLLTTAKLPKPFQINALTSKNWHLDSGWKSLSVVQE